MSNKITLKEFFESKEKLAIHCDTEEKANRLLKEFDKLGKVWRCGDKYIKYNCYGIYKNDTCYDNKGKFGSLISCCLKHNYKIYDFDDIIFEEQTKNLIPLIAKEIGVEVGEEFYIEGWSSYKHRFTEYQLEVFLTEWTDVDNETYRYVITNVIQIQKLPPKPKLTEVERVILQELCKKYTKITRIENTDLWVFNHSQDWKELCALSNLFQFIKNDREPYDIQELLEEYENLRSE